MRLNKEKRGRLNKEKRRKDDGQAHGDTRLGNGGEKGGGGMRLNKEKRSEENLVGLAENQINIRNASIECSELLHLKNPIYHKNPGSDKDDGQARGDTRLCNEIKQREEEKEKVMYEESSFSSHTGHDSQLSRFRVCHTNSYI